MEEKIHSLNRNAHEKCLDLSVQKSQREKHKELESSFMMRLAKSSSR